MSNRKDVEEKRRRYRSDPEFRAFLLAQVKAYQAKMKGDPKWTELRFISKRSYERREQIKRWKEIIGIARWKITKYSQDLLNLENRKEFLQKDKNAKSK